MSFAQPTTTASSSSKPWPSSSSTMAGGPIDSLPRLGERAPAAAAAPANGSSSVAQAYTRFLIHKASSIASAESAVRSATYLLPGRFEGAEIASEGVFSLLTLLHAFHSHLLHSHLLSLPPALRPALPPPTAHDRYTRSWARHSVLYRLASGALIGVGGVQLLGEMIALKGWASAGPAASTPEARAKGQRHWERRWKWLVGVEGTKAVLRLILLLLTSRPLLSPPLPSPSLDPALFAAAPAGSTKAEPSAADTGRPKDPIREILLPKTLFAGSLTPGRELVRALSPRGMLGEALHSVRGLIYVLMLRTRSSSLPVILSLLVALVSRALLRGQQATGYRKGKEREGAQVPLGSLERDEFARRDRALGGLLFRGVVWDGLTKPTLEAVASKTQRIPLVGLVGGLLSDYVPLIDSFYYYTAS